MKQMGTGMMMYAQDNDQILPTWSSYWACTSQNGGNNTTCNPSSGPYIDANSVLWDTAILPYVKSGSPGGITTVAANVVADASGGVWHCPDSELSTTYRSYGYSQGLTYSQGGVYRWPKEAEMIDPSRTVFVGDGGTDGRLGRVIDYTAYTQKYVTKPTPAIDGVSNYFTREAPERHFDGANYVFCDGHAKWMTGAEMFPHPGPPYPATVPTISKSSAYCARAKYFSLDQVDRTTYLNLARSSTYGGNSSSCPDVS